MLLFFHPLGELHMCSTYCALKIDHFIILIKRAGHFDLQALFMFQTN